MARTKSHVRGHTDAHLLVNAERLIATRLEEMLTLERFAYDPDAAHGLHRLRIAAKRLRYTLEIFQPAYDSYSTIGPAIKDATAWAERVQELLGELHDADVLVPQL